MHLHHGDAASLIRLNLNVAIFSKISFLLIY